MWNFTSTHILMAWCLIKHRTTLIFNTLIYTLFDLVIVHNATHAETCLCMVCKQITGVLNYRCSEAV
jgi:hypothetical protein